MCVKIEALLQKEKRENYAGKTKEMDSAHCALSDWNYGAGTRYHTEYEDEPRRIAHHLHAVRRGTDLRLGTAVFVAYLIFIVLQIVLLKGKFPPFQLLQVAASYLTSAFITIFDRIFPAPDQMGMRLLVLVLAIILTGIGAAVTVDVNIVPNPADGLARVLGERCGKNMGFGKNLFDFSAIVISLAIGLIDAGRPVGIGIGTVIAMVCTGRVIAAFNHFAKKKIEEITIA